VADVYVMNADGGGRTNLTPNSPPECTSNCYQGPDDDPAWSPDGSKIAFRLGHRTAARSPMSTGSCPAEAGCRTSGRWARTAGFALEMLFKHYEPLWFYIAVAFERSGGVLKRHDAGP